MRGFALKHSRRPFFAAFFAFAAWAGRAAAGALALEQAGANRLDGSRSRNRFPLWL